jgi:putative glutamine amidotransferase
MRPVIGITSYLEQARWGVWDMPADLIPDSYVRSVERAGGRPLVVPPCDEGVEETLDALDGIVFSGGSDLDPGLYGQDAHPATKGVVAERDRAELALLQAALARDVPVLAICRGSQVLNVARGGDHLHHHPHEVGHQRQSETPGVFGDHEVRVDGGSRLGAVLGDHAPVKSYHHQGLGAVGQGLAAVGWAEDGTLEAVEDPTRRFALGVLWHPEAGDDLRLFEALVAEARAYRAQRRR